MDLGECTKIHDLALRADYEIASKERDLFFELDVSEVPFTNNILLILLINNNLEWVRDRRWLNKLLSIMTHFTCSTPHYRGSRTPSPLKWFNPAFKKNALGSLFLYIYTFLQLFPWFIVCILFINASCTILDFSLFFNSFLCFLCFLSMLCILKKLFFPRFKALGVRLWHFYFTINQ